MTCTNGAACTPARFAASPLRHLQAALPAVLVKLFFS